MPSNTHLLVLPKNHSVRQLDAVDGPNGVPESETEFQRLVCYAMGVPCHLVMQSYSVSTSSSASANTADAGVHGAQMLRNTCTRVANSTCELLQEVYEQSYGGADAAGHSAQEGGKPLHSAKSKRVVFNISCSAVLSVGDIAELHFRQMVHDEAVSEMLSSAIGYPLDKRAQRLPWNRTVQKPTSTEAGATAQPEGMSRISSCPAYAVA